MSDSDTQRSYRNGLRCFCESTAEGYLLPPLVHFQCVNASHLTTHHLPARMVAVVNDGANPACRPETADLPDWFVLGQAGC